MKITYVQPKIFELEEEYIAFKLRQIDQVRAPPVVIPKETHESTPGAPKEQSTNFDASNQKPEGAGSEKAELPKGLQPRKIDFEQEEQKESKPQLEESK